MTNPMSFTLEGTLEEPMTEQTELRRLAEQATPGPWRWFDDGPGSPYLATVDRGRVYVMGFARKGLNQAQPMFQVREDSDHPDWGVMKTAAEIGPDWKNHPDAAFIVAAVNHVFATLAAASQPSAGRIEAFHDAEWHPGCTGQCDAMRMVRAALAPSPDPVRGKTELVPPDVSALGGAAGTAPSPKAEPTVEDVARELLDRTSTNDAIRERTVVIDGANVYIDSDVTFANQRGVTPQPERSPR